MYVVLSLFWDSVIVPIPGNKLHHRLEPVAVWQKDFVRVGLVVVVGQDLHVLHVGVRGLEGDGEPAGRPRIVQDGPWFPASNQEGANGVGCQFSLSRIPVHIADVPAKRSTKNCECNPIPSKRKLNCAKIVYPLAKKNPTTPQARSLRLTKYYLWLVGHTIKNITLHWTMASHFCFLYSWGNIYIFLPVVVLHVGVDVVGVRGPVWNQVAVGIVAAVH